MNLGHYIELLKEVGFHNKGQPLGVMKQNKGGAGPAAGRSVAGIPILGRTSTAPVATGLGGE